MPDQNINWEKFGKDCYYHGVQTAVKGLVESTPNKIDDVAVELLDKGMETFLPDGVNQFAKSE